MVGQAVENGLLSLDLSLPIVPILKSANVVGLIRPHLVVNELVVSIGVVGGPTPKLFESATALVSI